MKLGEVCNVVRGSSPRPKSDPQFYGGTVPRLMVADLTRDGKIVSARIDTRTELGAKQSRPMTRGNVVIAVSGAPGLPAILAHDACIHDGFVGLRNLDKNLNTDQIKGIEIPEMPLAKQRRIAAVLDRAEALRAKRRAALAQLAALTQSLFRDLFGDSATNSKGWPRVAFGDLLANVDSGWSPKCFDRPGSGKEWGILKLGAVTWCEYDATENKALPPDVEPDATIEVEPGDLLFARKNAYELVAACALVHVTPPRLLMSDLIFRFRLRPDAKLDSSFLHQLLIYPTKRREIQKLAGGSAGSMPNIFKARLQTALIEVPPLSLQRKFARLVTAVEKLKTAQRESLAELDAPSPPSSTSPSAGSFERHGAGGHAAAGGTRAVRRATLPPLARGFLGHFGRHRGRDLAAGWAAPPDHGGGGGQLVESLGAGAGTHRV